MSDYDNEDLERLRFATLVTVASDAILESTPRRGGRGHGSASGGAIARCVIRNTLLIVNPDTSILS